MLAGVDWVLRVVLVASLHVLESKGALVIAHIEGSTSKIVSEEVTESWSLGGTGGEHTKTHSGSDGVWSWWSKENRILDVESLHVWVSEVTLTHNDTTLEWMASNHDWMCVI